MARLDQAFRALLEKLDLDLAAADRRAGEVAEVLRAFPATVPDRGGVAIVAVALDHYYSSIEASLEMIARVFDAAPPTGSDWHRSLLRQARIGAQTRPPVVAAATADVLESLLAFRHFMRHAYAVDLEWKRMENLAAALPAVHPMVRADMAAFRAYVVECLDELGQRS